MPKKNFFAKRTHWQLELNPLSVMLQTLREKNIFLIDLTESNPTACGFQYPKDKILTALSQEQNMVYAPCAQGSLEARRAVSRYYQKKGITVDPQQIFLTASTSEAYSYLFRLLMNPQEKVLVARPSYPLFQFLIELNDAQMEFYPLLYDRTQARWHIDFPILENLISPSIRLLILVNPNNPTGSFITQKEFKKLQELCVRQGMAIVSDEVFSDYALAENPNRVVSVAAQNRVLSFSLGGISKSLGLPQMKLGWIAINGPQDMVEEAAKRLEIILDTYLSVNTPVQNALAQWLSLQEEIQGEIRTRLKKNLEFLQQALTSFDQKYCRYLDCEGGWYAVVTLPSGKLSEEEWVMDFLTKDHVYVHPGYFFDFNEEGYFVLSLLPDTTVFQEGLSRILNRIKCFGNLA